MTGFNPTYIDGIRKVISNLQCYLVGEREDFLADEMRQHAVGYQLCLWAFWAKLLGAGFSKRYPQLDMRDRWVLNPAPNWKEVWMLSEALPGIKQLLNEVTSAEQGNP